MAAWFAERIIDTGRLPLFCFFAGMVVGFVFIRTSTRLIRAQVRWWPGNVEPGGLHIHHVVFGVAFMIFFGVVSLAVPDDLAGWRAVAAAGFGVGTALVLDEFALILHLQDVYWSEEGRASVNALFVVTAVTGLLLVGFQPFVVEDLNLVLHDAPAARFWAAAPLLGLLALAVVTVLKGKTWTGLVGLFVPILLIVGAARLARPRSPWARWRYRDGRRRGTQKLTRAQRREARWREPVNRAWDRVQNVIAGAPNQPDPPPPTPPNGPEPPTRSGRS
ncbi:hypothetical protein JQS43_09475 [Natronosporangium hydrolyticum]|uniref:Integral membrane protein n=1 Tax=Natronosporangium hydrolyticum TaxID=2811111 RepID=A0A895YME6_9ACTN|nr:hypothetical protein [Natronosporangium hydrolyticum]QSB16483.1 hypothetical protein JQS43_09475 [Natronosporangium hydrolyticum]